MSRPGNGAAGLIAAVIAAATAASIVIVISVTLLTDRLISLRLAETAASVDPVLARRQGEAVDRERKSDPLAAPQVRQARTEIKSVEVVGIRDAAIVYRDRDGNILFKTDPMANVTVVAKNVDLPEITIRETPASKVDRVSVEGAKPSAPPLGCESSFARPSPAALTGIASRCLAARRAPTNFAAVR